MWRISRPDVAGDLLLLPGVESVRTQPAAAVDRAFDPEGLRPKSSFDRRFVVSDLETLEPEPQVVCHRGQESLAEGVDLDVAVGGSEHRFDLDNTVKILGGAPIPFRT